jgi:2-polyprenyl-6-methoxyphenol hydroxylase-like FAD-dependent oxidoreductase
MGNSHAQSAHTLDTLHTVHNNKRKASNRLTSRNGSLSKQSRQAVSVGIVGGGPAGLSLALVLSSIGFAKFHITIYEKRADKTRPQNLYLDFENILDTDSVVPSMLASVFGELWSKLQVSNTCIVSTPLFGDPTCFKVNDLDFYHDTQNDIFNVPNKLGGLVVPIHQLELALQELVAKKANIRIVQKDIQASQVDDLIAKHAIVFGCEGRHSIIAETIKSAKVNMPGISKPKQLHAIIVRFKTSKPVIVDPPVSTANHAQHKYRVFHLPDGTVTFIIQFRMKKQQDFSTQFGQLDQPTKQMIGQAYQHVQDQLGSIPGDASILHINIEPYYRKKAACLVHRQKGTALLALLGDSLNGVSFLSGWGLNSSFEQIAAFQYALTYAQSKVCFAKNSIAQALWLHQLGQTYHVGIYREGPVKSGIIRTLQVVCNDEFDGSKDDLKRSALNEHSAWLVSQLRFGKQASSMNSRNSLFDKYSKYLALQIQKLESPNNSNIWIRYHTDEKILDQSVWQAIQHPSLAVVCMATGIRTKLWQKQFNNKLDLAARTALENQDMLYDGYLYRGNLAHHAVDYLWKYDHIKAKPHKQFVEQTKSVVACFASIDLAWHMIRCLDAKSDVQAFLFKGSDFDAPDLPALPAVLSQVVTPGLPTESIDSFELDIKQMMQTLKTRFQELSSRVGTDVRVVVFVDQQFGRNVNHVLSAMRDALLQPNQVFRYAVGNSPVYR